MGETVPGRLRMGSSSLFTPSSDPVVTVTRNLIGEPMRSSRPFTAPSAAACQSRTRNPWRLRPDAPILRLISVASLGEIRLRPGPPSPDSAISRPPTGRGFPALRSTAHDHIIGCASLLRPVGWAGQRSLERTRKSAAPLFSLTPEVHSGDDTLQHVAGRVRCGPCCFRRSEQWLWFS